MTRTLQPITFLICAAFLAACTLASAQDFASRFNVIDRVEYLQQDSVTPPIAGSNWEILPLPYGSRESKQKVSSNVIWMRFILEKPQDAENYSLYFHRHNLYLDLYFNGQRIGGDTHRPDRHTTSWNHPLIVNIQNANWRESDNEVLIRFVASDFGGFFYQIVFGKTAELTPLLEETYYQRIQINSWLQVIGFLVTALATCLWAFRRNYSTYLLLAGMAATWSVLTTHMVVYYNLIEYRYWLPLVHLAMHTFTLLFFKLLYKLNNHRDSFSQKLILVWYGIAVTWNQFGSLEFWWVGSYILHAIGCSFVVYMLFMTAKKAFTTKDRLAMAISITVALQIYFFSHDIIISVFEVESQWETGVHYTQFAFPLLLIVFAAILLNRFVSALSLAENMNKVLEAKVEESRQIIEQSYAERRQLELQQAAEKERQTIYRDLHDDVGSKLLSIVHAGRDNTLGELARTALESLRNAVSRANSQAQSLGSLLEDIQEEASLRLEGSGHQLRWQQPQDIPEAIIPADTEFNLNRIFRELISNIIRHANASVIGFNFTYSNSVWAFEVLDDGVGLIRSNTSGNGLGNIKQRIADINGTLEWHPVEPSGTRVTIEVPK